MSSNPNDQPFLDSSVEKQNSQDKEGDDLDHARERLFKCCGGNPEIASSLCDAFLQEVPDLMRKLASGHLNQHAFLTTAHTLKSCLKYVASEEAIRSASDLELAAKQDQSIAPEMLDRLKEVTDYWMDVVRKLKTLIS